MTDTDPNLEAKKSQAFPDHWSLFLHCTICFGFFHNPHTLECGHSFCKRCLKRLAEIARDDNPDVRLRRLSLTCPACRHPFPAKSVLKGRARTCIVIKQLVELWKRECKLLLASPSQCRRSICSQTEPAGDQDKTDESSPGSPKTAPFANLQEVFSTRAPPADEYFETLMRRVSETCDEIEQDQSEHGTGFKTSAMETDTERIEHSSSSDSDSSVTTSSSADGGAHGDGASADGRRSMSNVSVPDIFGRLSMSAMVLGSGDNFPARVLLIAVWFVYSLLIVALAETFLPYVILFTLFFFLIVLK